MTEATKPASSARHWPHPALSVLCRLAAMLLDLPTAWIAVADDAGWCLIAANGASPATLPAGTERLHDAALEHGDHPLMLGDLRGDPGFARPEAIPAWFPVGCFAGMRLLGGDGTPTGVLCAHGPTTRRFTPADAGLVQQLGRVAGTVLGRLEGEHGTTPPIGTSPDASPARVDLAPTVGNLSPQAAVAPPGEPGGPDWFELVHPLQRDEIAARWRRTGPGVPFVQEFRARDDDGPTRWLRVSVRPPANDAGPQPARPADPAPPWSGSLQVVDQLLTGLPNARDPLTFDMLTGLANRARFQMLLERAVRDARLGIPFALLCLDLDEFKLVNESLGHKAGDRILRKIGSRLSLCVRRGDVVGRLGGDEFLVIQTCVDSPADTMRLGQRIIQRLREPMQIDGRPVSVGVSIGVALGPRDGGNGETLLHHAELALYRAKQDGRGVLRVFDPTMESDAIQHRLVKWDLRHALERSEFTLDYQPIVSLREGRVVCLEALLRWRHPVRGPVPPSAFIPIAENAGLIIPIGDWVLREACRTALCWPPHVRVAVNLSARQFTGCDMVAQVSEVLAQTGLSPDRLELEITETLPLLDNDCNVEILDRLRALGVRLVLDDFGVGYSSLAYLGRFRFDGLKLDRQFVAAMAQPQGRAIARTIVDLASSLGSTVTAEGIETARQLQQVTAKGCSEVQGFWIARPMSADRIADALEAIENRFRAERDTG